MFIESSLQMQNPKSEYRAKRPSRTIPKQIRNPNNQMSQLLTLLPFWIFNFGHLKLFRNSDFVLRISASFK